MDNAQVTGIGELGQYIQHKHNCTLGMRMGKECECGLTDTLARHRRSAAPQSQAALVEALTPSGDTKAAYMGEFSFDITETFFDEDRETFEEQSRKVYVPWTTIKEIMAAIKDRSTKATGEKP